MTLDKKHRPPTLDDMVGNEETVANLDAILNRDVKDRPHCFLFTGPAGCGKTTLARITVTMLGCSEEDFRELNTADFRGIETSRKMITDMQYYPVNGKCKVFFMDECHQLTRDGQEALLKAMEDGCPEDTYLLFATTEPERLKDTFRRRCTKFTVEEVSGKRIEWYLKKIAKFEKIKLSEETLDQIVEESNGSIAMALNLLDTVMDVDEDKMLEIVKTKATEKKKVGELCRALMKGNNWNDIRGILKDLEDMDAEGVRKIVLKYFTKVLLGGNERAYLVMESFKPSFYYIGKAGLVMACYESLK